MIDCKIIYQDLMKNVEQRLDFYKDHQEAVTKNPCQIKLGLINFTNSIYSYNDDNIYIKNIMRDCVKLGIVPTVKVFNLQSNNNLENIIEQAIEAIEEMKQDKDCLGIVIPDLPDEVEIYKGILEESMNTKKDIDTFNLNSVYCNYPSTVMAVMYILSDINYHFAEDGKVVCVIGRSPHLGQSMVNALVESHATVINCNSLTPRNKMKDLIKKSDIIISMTGKAELIKADWVNDEQIIIDVGISINSKGKICGDCEPEVYEKVPLSTPVPGGVGLVTRGILFNNLADNAFIY